MSRDLVLLAISGQPSNTTVKVPGSIMSNHWSNVETSSTVDAACLVLVRNKPRLSQRGKTL